MALVYAAAETCGREHLLRPRGGSSSKATSSTGGTRRAAGACARAAPTTCLAPLRGRALRRRRPATRACWTSASRSSRRRRSQPTQESAYLRTRVSRRAARSSSTASGRSTRSLTAGAHGLPLIGSGDWNDGMNRVGVAGKGESVWLGWFLYTVLGEFAPICRRAARRRARRSAGATRGRLKAALEAAAGTASGTGARISTTARRSDRPQTRSAGSTRSRSPGRFSRARPIRSAPDARWTRSRSTWSRRDDRLVLLFTPPFDRSPQDPGYIKGYPPGVRENGGQYTHAAIWASWRSRRSATATRRPSSSRC